MNAAVRNALWLLYAASPVVAGGWALLELRPPPAEAGSDHELWLGSGSTRDAARRHPGHPALDVAELSAPPYWPRLPFDVVRRDGAPPVSVQRSEWSVLESWPRWDVTARHDGEASRCTGRLVTGGVGCGRGLRFVPDVVRMDGLLGGDDNGDGELWGAVRITEVPGGSEAELRLPDAPASVSGTLVPLAEGEVELRVWRRGVETAVRCSRRCSFGPPPGDGPLLVRVRGPNPPLAFELHEGASGGAP